MKYLDETGLARLWEKIKAYVDSHNSGGTNPISNPTFIEMFGTGSDSRTLSSKDVYYNAFGSAKCKTQGQNENGVFGDNVVPSWASIPNLSTETPIITILTPGRYRIDYSVYFYTGFTAGDIVFAGILKNYVNSSNTGASDKCLSRARVQSASAYLNVSGYCIVDCEAGDNLRLVGKNNTAARGTINTNGATRMLITKMY